MGKTCTDLLTLSRVLDCRKITNPTAWGAMRDLSERPWDGLFNTPIERSIPAQRGAWYQRMRTLLLCRLFLITISACVRVHQGGQIDAYDRDMNCISNTMTPCGALEHGQDLFAYERPRYQANRLLCM